MELFYLIWRFNAKRATQLDAQRAGHIGKHRPQRIGTHPQIKASGQICFGKPEDCPVDRQWRSSSDKRAHSVSWRFLGISIRTHFEGELNLVHRTFPMRTFPHWECWRRVRLIETFDSPQLWLHKSKSQIAASEWRWLRRKGEKHAERDTDADTLKFQFN